MKKNGVKTTLSILMVFLMVFFAQVLNEKEIIFPEIAALVIGAWYAKKQPWIVNSWLFVVVMTLSSLIGVGIVCYIDTELILQIILGLFSTIVILIVSKTTMVPLVSACILPIIMGTNTMVYPISVCVMSIVIAFIQKYTQDNVEYQPYRCSKNDYIHWIKRFIILVIYSAIALYFKQKYLIAPPLFVTFIEFSNVNSKLRERYLDIVKVMIAASIIGYISRMLNVRFDLELWICAIISMMSIIFIFEVQKVIFPPAGAIALLPLILNSEALYVYPIEVTISSIILIVIALAFFKKNDIKKEINLNVLD